MDSPSSGMFWGLVLKPEKRYEQVVLEAFHVSKACLEFDPSKSEDVTSVYIETDDEEYLLCNLTNKNLNEGLDLNFNAGDTIVLKTTGSGVVHLTGFNIVEEEDDPMMMYDSDDEDGEEEEESEEEEVEVPTLVNGKKRKMSSSGDALPAKKKNVELSPLDKLLANGKAKGEDLRKKLDAKKNGKKKEEEEEESSDADDTDEEDDSEEFVDDEAEEGEEEESGEEDMETDESPAKKETNGAPAKEESPKKKDEASPEKKDIKKETPESSKKKKQLNGGATPKAEESPQKEAVKETTEPQSANKKKKNKNKKGANNETTEAATPAKEGQKSPKPQKTPKRTLKGGIIAEDLKVGNGPEAKKGKMVGMYYEGKLKANQKTFDSTLTGKPFKFRLGQGEVIKGWDIGVDGMKVGGKRRLTIPPQMAYGAQGAGSDIPPNAHLVFDVECKAVN